MIAALQLLSYIKKPEKQQEHGTGTTRAWHWCGSEYTHQRARRETSETDISMRRRWHPNSRRKERTLMR